MPLVPKPFQEDELVGLLQHRAAVEALQILPSAKWEDAGEWILSEQKFLDNLQTSAASSSNQSQRKVSMSWSER